MQLVFALVAMCVMVRGQFSDMPLTSIKIDPLGSGTIFSPQTLIKYKFTGLVFIGDSYQAISVVFDYKKEKTRFLTLVNEQITKMTLVAAKIQDNNLKNANILKIEEVKTEIYTSLADTINFEEFFAGEDVVLKKRKKRFFKNVWNKLTCGGVTGAALSLIGASSNCGGSINVDHLTNAVEANTDALQNLTGGYLALTDNVNALKENTDVEFESVRLEMEKNRNYTITIMTKLEEASTDLEIAIEISDGLGRLRTDYINYKHSVLRRLSRLKRLSRSTVGEKYSSADIPLSYVTRAVEASKSTCTSDNTKCLLFTEKIKEWATSLFGNIEVIINVQEEKIVTVMYYPVANKENMYLRYVPSPVPIRYINICKVPLHEILDHDLLIDQNTVTAELTVKYMKHGTLRSCISSAAAAHTCTNELVEGSEVVTAQWTKARIFGDSVKSEVGAYYRVKNVDDCPEASVIHVGDNRYITTGFTNLSVSDTKSGLRIHSDPAQAPGTLLSIPCSADVTVTQGVKTKTIHPPKICASTLGPQEIKFDEIGINTKFGKDSYYTLSDNHTASDVKALAELWDAEVSAIRNESIYNSASFDEKFDENNEVIEESYNSTLSFINYARSEIRKQREVNEEAAGSSPNTLSYVNLGIGILGVIIGGTGLGLVIQTRTTIPKINFREESKRLTFIFILLTTFIGAYSFSPTSLDFCYKSAHFKECQYRLFTGEYSTDALLEKPCVYGTLAFAVLVGLIAGIILVCCFCRRKAYFRGSKTFTLVIILILTGCFGMKMNSGVDREIKNKVSVKYTTSRGNDYYQELADNIEFCKEDDKRMIRSHKNLGFDLPNLNIVLGLGHCAHGYLNGGESTPGYFQKCSGDKTLWVYNEANIQEIVSRTNVIKNDVLLELKKQNDNNELIKEDMELIQEERRTHESNIISCIASKIRETTAEKITECNFVEFEPLISNDRVIYFERGYLCGTIFNSDIDLAVSGIHRFPLSSQVPIKYGCSYTDEIKPRLACSSEEGFKIRDKSSRVLLGYQTFGAGLWEIDNSWCLEDFRSTIIGCGHHADTRNDVVFKQIMPSVPSATYNIDDPISEDNITYSLGQCFPSPGCVTSGSAVQTGFLISMIMPITKAFLKVKDCEIEETIQFLTWSGWMTLGLSILLLAGQVGDTLAKSKVSFNGTYSENDKERICTGLAQVTVQGIVYTIIMLLNVLITGFKNICYRVRATRILCIKSTKLDHYKQSYYNDRSAQEVEFNGAPQLFLITIMSLTTVVAADLGVGEIVAISFGIILAFTMAAIVVLILYFLPGGTPPPDTFMMPKYKGCAAWLRNFLWSHGRLTKTYFCVAFTAVWTDGRGLSNSKRVRICYGTSNMDKMSVKDSAVNPMNFKLTSNTKTGTLTFESRTNIAAVVANVDLVSIPATVSRQALATKLNMPTNFTIVKSACHETGSDPTSKCEFANTYLVDPIGESVVHPSNLEYYMVDKKDKKQTVKEAVSDVIKIEMEDVKNQMNPVKDYWAIYAATNNPIKLTSEETALLVRWFSFRNMVGSMSFDRPEVRMAAAAIMTFSREDSSKALEGDWHNVTGAQIDNLATSLSAANVQNVSFNSMRWSLIYGIALCIGALAIWFVTHILDMSETPADVVIKVYCYVLLYAMYDLFSHLKGSFNKLFGKSLIIVDAGIRKDHSFFNGDKIQHCGGFGLLHEIRHYNYCHAVFALSTVPVFFIETIPLWIYPLCTCLYLHCLRMLEEMACDDNINLKQIWKWAFLQRHEGFGSYRHCTVDSGYVTICMDSNLIRESTYLRRAAALMMNLNSRGSCMIGFTKDEMKWVELLSTLKGKIPDSAFYQMLATIGRQHYWDNDLHMYIDCLAATGKLDNFGDFKNIRTNHMKKIALLEAGVERLFVQFSIDTDGEHTVTHEWVDRASNEVVESRVGAVCHRGMSKYRQWMGHARSDVVDKFVLEKIGSVLATSEVKKTSELEEVEQLVFDEDSLDDDDSMEPGSKRRRNAVI